MTCRMPRALVLAVGLAFSGLLPAADRPPSDRLPADSGPWVVRAYFEDKGLLNRLARRTAPWEVNHAEGFAVVEVDNRFEYQRLLADGFRVAVDDALTAFVRNPRGGPEAVPGYACYRTVEETRSTLADLAAAHPTLASVIDIGDSWEKQQNPALGYDLTVLRLSNSAISGDKPKVFMIGAVHAREYTTAETLTRFGEWLLAEYADNADVRWLLDHQEVHLLPHGNPDGRKYAEAGQLWRKTVNQAYCGATSSNRGADINRNYPFEWGGHGGSSGDPCSAIYRGPTPASESETAAIIAYARTLFPDVRPPDLVSPAPADTPGVFVDVHSYSRLVLWPWGFSETPTGNGAAFATLGRRAAWFPGYTPQAGIELYPTDGGSKDFVYGELGVAALSFELGDAFFEPCAGFESTIWPDNRRAFEYLLRVARAPYLLPAGPSLENIVSAPVRRRNSH
jgi:carboxypeptidase T